MGVHDSLRVTCVTGQTSRQNLWPEEKQLYAALRHCSVNSSVGVGSEGSSRARAISSGITVSSSALSRMPGVNGIDTGSDAPGGSSWVIRGLLPATVTQVTVFARYGSRASCHKDARASAGVGRCESVVSH